MTSETAIKKAVETLGPASFSYGAEHAAARAKVAQTWLNIAEFLRQEEER